jgi:hypothetical protein
VVKKILQAEIEDVTRSDSAFSDVLILICRVMAGISRGSVERDISS